MVALVLFGSTRLPEMARGLGQAVCMATAETREVRGDAGQPPGSDPQAQLTRHDADEPAGPLGKHES